MSGGRILVIKLGALGDVVQALGPMAAIRRHHHGAHIVALTTSPYMPLLAACPYVDDVWVDSRPRLSQPGALLDLRRRLRGGHFDRVYDLQTSGRSSSYFRLMGPGPRPEWSGIARGASHPHANPNRDSLHSIERQRDQLTFAGIDEVPLPDVSWLKADISRYGLRDGFVLLVPGGAATRPRKRWPLDRYVTLAGELATWGRVPVILGGAQEKDLAQAICSMVPAARDLTGDTSFAEIASLARVAHAAVGNDTGPMHLIAAAGGTCVSLFSDDSDPALCAPYGKVTVLRRADLTELPVRDVIAALP